MLTIRNCNGAVHTVAPGTEFNVIGAADSAMVVMRLPVVDQTTGWRIRIDLTERLRADVANAVLDRIWFWLAEGSENHLDLRCAVADAKGGGP